MFQTTNQLFGCQLSCDFHRSEAESEVGTAPLAVPMTAFSKGQVLTKNLSSCCETYNVPSMQPRAICSFSNSNNTIGIRVRSLLLNIETGSLAGTNILVITTLWWFMGNNGQYKGSPRPKWAFFFQQPRWNSIYNCEICEIHWNSTSKKMIQNPKPC